MPGWTSHVVQWVQQFAEEEGLLLGMTLAGYALDMWFRLFQARKSLERIKKAPAVGLSALPRLAEVAPEATSPDRASGPSEPGAESSFREGSSADDQGRDRGESQQGNRAQASASAPELSAGQDSAGASSSGDSPSPAASASAVFVVASPKVADSIVIVRGRVQPSSDTELWQLLTGPHLLKAEFSSAKGVVLERIDKVVLSNMHQFLHNVSEHQVDVHRSEVPFELSEIPGPTISLSPSPTPPTPSNGISLPSLPTPQLSFPFPNNHARIRVSLEGLTQPLPLVTVHSSFHRSSPSLTSVILHFLTGSQPIGQKVEERLLMPGTDLTAVGHMRKDDDGRITIAPAPELPVFLTPLSKDQLVVHLSGTCAALFNTSVLFSLAAVGTLGYVFYRRWDHRRRQERARRLVEDAAELERAEARRRQQQDATGGSEVPAASLTNGHARQEVASGAAGEEPPEDLANVGNGELCVVCLSQRRRAVFVPCGHFVCCWGCAQSVQDRSRAHRRETPACPVCRAPFTNAVRVYSS